MEELQERLADVALLPYEEYTPETELKAGAAGLEIYAAYSRLYQMKMEFSHAGEFISAGNIKDVQETLQEYEEILSKMIERLQRKQEQLLENLNENKKVRSSISLFLEAFVIELTKLKEESKIENSHKCTMNMAEHYQERLIRLCEISRGYMVLHIGNTSYMD